MSKARLYLRKRQYPASETHPNMMGILTDEAPPAVRGDCESLRACPWCCKVVSMRVQDDHEKDEIDRSDGQENRNVDSALSTRDMEHVQELRADVAMPVRLRHRKASKRGQSSRRTEQELRVLRVRADKARDVQNHGVHMLEVDAPALPKSEKQKLYTLRRPGDNGMPKVADVSGVLRGHGDKATSKADDRSHQQQRELRTEQLPVGRHDHPDQKSQNIFCPNCKGRVMFDDAMGAENWRWIHYDQRADQARVDARGRGGPSQIKNHCRPCATIHCRHNIAREFTTHKWGQTIYVDITSIKESCALDVADKHEGYGITLEDTGEILGITRERVRQIEEKALAKILKVLEKD